MKTAIIEASDLHSNSTVAICPPKVNLDDGGTHHASREQRWMYDGWLDFIAWSKGLTTGYRRVGVLGGDAGELDAKDRSTQLITTNRATVLRIVADVLDPFVGTLDSFYVIRGTEAHSGKAAWLEEAIGKDMGAINSKQDVYSFHQLRITADRVRLDIAHHASMPSLPWTEKNAANKIASIAMWRYGFDLEQPIPDLVFRSHNHRWSDSFDNHKTRAICMPCWSLLTEHGYRIGAENSKADIGGTVTLCDGGKYEVHKFKLEPMKGRVWKLQA